MSQGQTPRPTEPPALRIQDEPPHPEQVAGQLTGSPESSGATGRARLPSTSSTQHLVPPSGTHTAPPHSHDNPYADFEQIRPPPPPPPLPPPPPSAHSRDGNHRPPPFHRQTVPSGLPAHTQYGLDLGYIVPDVGSVRRDVRGDVRRPVQDKIHDRYHDHVHLTVGERIQPTINNAVKEKDKYAYRAWLTKNALNIAIGLQVSLGALTTLTAALQSGKQIQVSTSVLGGLSTLVASFLASARGSGEPDLSITRVSSLEQFLRECKAFQLDHAHEHAKPGDELDHKLEYFRRRLEELLGNITDDRKKSVTTTAAAPAAPAAPTAPAIPTAPAGTFKSAA